MVFLCKVLPGVRGPSASLCVAVGQNTGESGLSYLSFHLALFRFGFVCVRVVCFCTNVCMHVRLDSGRHDSHRVIAGCVCLFVSLFIEEWDQRTCWLLVSVCSSLRVCTDGANSSTRRPYFRSCSLDLVHDNAFWRTACGHGKLW